MAALRSRAAGGRSLANHKPPRRATAGEAASTQPLSESGDGTRLRRDRYQGEIGDRPGDGGGSASATTMSRRPGRSNPTVRNALSASSSGPPSERLTTASRAARTSHGVPDESLPSPSRDSTLEVQVAADEEIERRHHVAIVDVAVESRAVAELGARAMLIGLLVEDAADPAGAEILLPV